MVSFEKFQPRLKPGSFVQTPAGVIFELEDASKQVHLPTEASLFVALMDGQHSIQQIIEKVHQAHQKVPFKGLVSTIQKLNQNGCLENSAELQGEEFEARPEIFDKTETWWEQPLFSLKLNNPIRLGRSFSWAFAVVAGLVVLLGGFALFTQMQGGPGQSAWTDEFLRINGSYRSGIAFFVIGISLLISLKNLLKAFLSLLLTGRVGHLRLELNLYSLAIRFHDDRIYLLPSKSLAVLSIGAIALSPFLLTKVVAALGLLPVSYESFFILSLIVFIVDTNPFRKSELTAFFNMLYNQKSVSHLLPYLKKRSLTAVIGRREKIADESIYIGYATVAILWTVFAFNIFLALIERNYSQLLSAILSGGQFDKVAATLVLGGLLVTSVYLVGDLAKTLLSNLLQPWVTSRRNATTKMKTVAAKVSTPRAHFQILRSQPLFQNISDQALLSILYNAEVRTYKKGAYIILQDTDSSEFYVMSSGAVEVRKRHPTGAEVKVAQLTSPVCFGENTLLNQAKRSASVVALETCEVICIPLESLKELERQGESTADYASIVGRLHAGQAISQSPLFREAPAEAVGLFLNEGEIVRFKAGEPIIQQRQTDKDFYLITRGKVSVMVDQKKLNSLGQGDFFGEMALLFDAPRSASVIADEETSLLKLSAQSFWKVVSAHLNLALFLETVSELRQRSDKARAA